MNDKWNWEFRTTATSTLDYAYIVLTLLTMREINKANLNKQHHYTISCSDFLCHLLHGHINRTHFSTYWYTIFHISSITLIVFIFVPNSDQWPCHSRSNIVQMVVRCSFHCALITALQCTLHQGKTICQLEISWIVNCNWNWKIFETITETVTKNTNLNDTSAIPASRVVAVTPIINSMLHFLHSVRLMLGSLYF